jgi:hypothetical protein
MTLDEIKDILIPIGTYILALYGPEVKAAVAEIWSVSGDPFWWKVRASLVSLFTCFVPVLQKTWDVYGVVLIALVVKLVKSKVGLAPAARAIRGK